jgi:DNA-binding beta-propeller fold protein YncE
MIDFDSNGGLLFADQGGAIRRVALQSGAVVTLAGQGDDYTTQPGAGTNARFSVPIAGVSDGSGTIYVAEPACRCIRSFAVGTTSQLNLVAGTPGMEGTMDGAALTAQFRWPGGIAYDRTKKILYVADQFANTIRAIDLAAATPQVTTVAGVVNMSGFADGAAASALFSSPQALLLDPSGNLLIADHGNNRLRKLDVAGKVVSTVRQMSYGPDAMAWQAPGQLLLSSPLRRLDLSTGMVTIYEDDQRNQIFDWLNGITVDTNGTFLLGDDSAVLRYDPTSKKLTSVAGYQRPWAHTNGGRLQARFTGIAALTVRADGQVFFRDGDIVRIDNAGVATTVVASSSPTFGWDGNMTFADDGKLYSLDRGGHTVVRVDVDTGTWAPFVGMTGSPGATDATGTNARFAQPLGITADGGKLYVADNNNHTIRAIDIATGAVSTLAGTAGQCGHVDMPGAMARFCNPQDVLADHKGNLYVASEHNIRKIVINGASVSTIAGNDMFGWVDGVGTAARFFGPWRLALDATARYLYVAENANDDIRRIDLNDNTVTTVAGGPRKTQVVEGALPGAINQPGAIGFLPSGELLAVINREHAIIQIRLP